MAPRWFASVGQRFRTPWVSLVLNAIVAIVLLWTKSFGYVLDISIIAMFIVYGIHSMSAMLLPWMRPALFKQAEVKLKPWMLVVFGVISVAAMAYLTVSTIARDISRHAGLPADQRGLAIWELLLLWIAVGTVLYLIARWEGRREGFNYELQLARDIAPEQATQSGA